MASTFERFLVSCVFVLSIAHTGVLCDHHATKGMKEDLEKIDLEGFFDKMNSYLSTIKGAIDFPSNFSNAVTEAGLDMDTDLPEHFKLVNILLPTHTEKLVYMFKLPTNETCALEKCIEIFKQRPPFYQYRYRIRDTVCVGLKFDAESRKIAKWRAAMFSMDGKELKRMEPKKAK